MRVCLDKELGGKPITEEIIKNLTDAQSDLLTGINEKNAEMVTLHKGLEEAKKILEKPEIELGDDTERTTAGLFQEHFGVNKAKITSKMQKLLIEAIEHEALCELGVVQRMCERYDLVNEIKAKFNIE